MSGLLQRSSDLSPGSRWRRGAAGLIFLALLLTMWAFRRRWIFTCDDAYISFRYAANLVEYGALTFDTGHVPPVEGYTNFAWVVLVAAGMWLGVPPEPWTGALGLAAGGLILWCIVSWAAGLPGRAPRRGRWSWARGWWLRRRGGARGVAGVSRLDLERSGDLAATAAVVGCATRPLGDVIARRALAALSIRLARTVVPRRHARRSLPARRTRGRCPRCVRGRVRCPAASRVAVAYYGAWLPHTGP